MRNKSTYIESINSENYIQAAELLSEIFFNTEPVTSSLGLNKESYKRMVIRFCRVIGQDGLCFVAREYSTGKIVGVITNIDMMIDFGEKFKNETEKFSDVMEKLAPDIALTSALEEPFNNKMNFKPFECLHLFQCVVLPEYSGRYIASDLTEHTLFKAKKFGYKWAAVDCTSTVSAKIFEKLGFKLENKIKYSDFVYKNIRIFEKLEGYYYFFVKEL